MDKKKDQIKKQLSLYEGLHRLSSSSDYQNYLKPILQEAFQNKWPDPTQAKTPEEFHKQYTEAYGRSMAYMEIFNLLANAGSVAQNLSKQLKNPDRNYEI